MSTLQLLVRAACLAGLTLLAGCGSKDTPQGLDLGGADANAIGILIDDINEAKGNPKRTSALFASGVKAPDARKLNEYEFSLAGKPSISGDTATCPVRIDSAKTGATTQKDWSFVKEGGTWKIKDAPLP